MGNYYPNILYHFGVGALAADLARYNVLPAEMQHQENTFKTLD